MFRLFAFADFPYFTSYSHYYWSDCAGMAYVGTMCSYSSTAVNAVCFYTR